MLVDAHAHLDLEQFAADQAETIARARETGVARIINVGVEPSRWQASLELAQAYPGYIYLALGLHPNDILRTGNPAAALDWLEKIIAENKGKVVAVGETGLDYYHDDVPPDVQHTWFVKQIELARRVNLPLVVHCRDAMPDCIAVLRQHAADLKIMMHCFTGSLAEANECLALPAEVYISIAGPVTFAKAFDRHEVAREVPLERLLTETDCPYLTPHPYRGKRNEPARVRLVAEKIAELKNLPYDEVARQTGWNVARLFNLPE